METITAFPFFITVLPLICTPGPDILLISSHGKTHGKTAALLATTGVLLGYAAHAVLSALGVAALVAASPILFTILKWCGIAYLLFLAVRMLISAVRGGAVSVAEQSTKKSLFRGFLTSFLNPKGLLVYLAILPQFISPDGRAAYQALIYSALFIGCCSIVYSAVGLSASLVHGQGIHGTRFRIINAVAGGLLIIAVLYLVL